VNLSGAQRPPERPRQQRLKQVLGLPQPFLLLRPQPVIFLDNLCVLLL
jgi:hypothetical protein